MSETQRIVSPSGVLTVVPTRGSGFFQIDRGSDSLGRPAGASGISPKRRVPEGWPNLPATSRALRSQSAAVRAGDGSGSAGNTGSGNTGCGTVGDDAATGRSGGFDGGAGGGSIGTGIQTRSTATPPRPGSIRPDWLGGVQRGERFFVFNGLRMRAGSAFACRRHAA
ncbi:MAG: hypothetical protein ACREVI_12505 [Steroidobacteraceae bacterium]